MQRQLLVQKAPLEDCLGARQRSIAILCGHSLIKLSGDFSREVLKFVKISSDFSKEVLKFVKFTSQKTRVYDNS